jgi:hypothetical protein
VGATHTPTLIHFHWRFVFPTFRSARASGLILPVAFLSPVPCFCSIQRAAEYLHSPPCSSSIRGVDSLQLREGFCPETLLLAFTTTLWSPSPVHQLVSEPVWLLVGFNRLCDLKATWRKVLLSLWSSMARIPVTGKTELATIF